MNQILRPDERFGLALRDLYHRHGYQPYRMSKFEAYDLYVRNKSFLVSENIITFTDTNGQLMALKPDVTLSIVKNAPPAGGALQKVYYHENVYRTSPAAMGYREIMQTGLECTGNLDLCALSEVLSLAAESLALLNNGEYLLDLGHMGVVSGLLEGQEERIRRELLLEMGRKNAPAIRTVCAQAGICHDLAETLCRLALLYGAPETVLPQLKELGPAVRPALEELESLCSLLKEKGLSRNLRLDFSIVNDMNYYTGVIFRGYLPGLPSGVLAGGRYDNLLRRMGKQGGAIGFAVYLDQLERLDKDTEYDVDVLLLYSAQDDPAAVNREAERLAAQNKTVRTDRSIPQNLRYREMIHFKGDAQ
ncbi:MAG: ATP phosphoribosyltransferase regulatory subunit [Oscillospiraceae bacterium]|nr:ATP phosphoribosyltransferase regulatory subunit [Oscillospiraceae bacterium]